MKKLFVLLTTILLPLMANAHDITVKNAQGVTIYYNYINGGTELAVTYCGPYSTYLSNEYRGNVVIPEEVTFMNRTRKVTSIGESAFQYCYGLTSVTIPNSVTSIEEDAFYECSGLTSVTIPNSVTSIGKQAFDSCSGLTSVTIGNSVTSIGERAFDSCSGLKKVIAPDIAAWCGINFGNAIANPLYYVHHLYSDDNTEITELVIPDGVTSIGSGAFSGCSGLTSVTIPNSVTSIGSDAFNGCSGLTSITIPNSVTTIGYDAFYDCKNLTSVTIGNGVTSIGGQAFSGCSGLTSVTFLCKTVDSWFRGFKSIKELKFGSEVTEIKMEAFRGCIGLSSVTIESKELSIGYNAFGDFKQDSKPEKVIWLTDTPPSGYSYAEGQVNYVVNEQYRSLSNKTVYPFLSSMFEVDGVKYVPLNLSDNTCDAIDCNYNESATNVNIGNTVSYQDVGFTVKQVNPFVCCGNRHIKNVQFDFCGSIPESAFQGCSNLTSVTIGNSVTSLERDAFNSCSSLTSITIPNSVTSIGYSAFNCKNLATVVSLIEKPFEIFGIFMWTLGSFSQETFNNATLYVPKGTKDIYEATGGWKDFANIVEGTPTGITSVTSEKETPNAPIYDLNGRRLTEPQKGINIIGGKKVLNH